MISRYILKPGMALRIDGPALDTLAGYRQAYGANEAGGILLGREYPGREVVIEEVTVPCGADCAGPTWFDRSHSGAQEAVDQAWHRGAGELIYLGEWHSHPEKVPTPSLRDRAMIRNMLKDTRMETDFLILIIVGRSEVWVGLQSRDGLRKLRLLE